jgi:tetrahydromethanopterin S-methyltransferase subunit G
MMYIKLHRFKKKKGRSIFTYYGLSFTLFIFVIIISVSASLSNLEE